MGCLVLSLEMAVRKIIIRSLPCRGSNRQMKVDDQVMQEGNTKQSRAYNAVRGDRLGNIYIFIWRTITSG